MSDDPFLRLAAVGRCQLQSRLGEGGMGVVYRGRHTDLDLDVAVKFLHPHLARQGNTSERFLREARLAARLAHPGIVRVYDCGETEGHFYMVMELVDGQPLSSVISDAGPVPVPRALQIIEAVAGALREALDQAGLIHRDIKPANILVTTTGQPKLVDLGLAKVISAAEMPTAQTAAGTVMGTPQYMPPEQFRDASSVDHRADIYSLGATLYHMLTGHPPFEGDSFFALLKQVEETDPEPFPSHIPLAVEELVARMLSKRADQRFQTYAELIEAIRSLEHPQEPATKLPTATIVAPVDTSSLIPTIKTAGRVLRPATPAENRVLLVVDIQNDFCPGGALAVPRGDEIIPRINKLARKFAHVILTQDWHNEDHLSFASSHPGRKAMEHIELPYGSQILWPEHCVQGTEGAEFHPGLKIPHCELVIRKGYHHEIDSYSAFFENDRQTPTGLAGYLRERGLTQLFVVGLATDFCVAYTALDGRRLGFDVTVIEESCAGIDHAGSLASAWQQMEEAGVIRA